MIVGWFLVWAFRLFLLVVCFVGFVGLLFGGYDVKDTLFTIVYACCVLCVCVCVCVRAFSSRWCAPRALLPSKDFRWGALGGHTIFRYIFFSPNLLYIFTHSDTFFSRLKGAGGSSSSSLHFRHTF